MKYLSVFLLIVSANVITAQTPCPPPVEIRPCGCTAMEDGYEIYCNTGLPIQVSQVQDALRGTKPYGPVARLIVRDILEGGFEYVTDDFLVGIPIADVNLHCDHEFTTTLGPLEFSIDAFISLETGLCTLTKNLTITNCNLRQFNADIVGKCDQLEKLGFVNSYVESLGRFPVIDTLKNLTLNHAIRWKSEPVQGLVRLPFTADNVPNLRYFDVTGNGLDEDDIFPLIPTMTGLQQLFLEGNILSVMPDITGLSNLEEFSITLNETVMDISVHLPTSRNPSALPLNATIKSSGTAVRRLAELTGDLAGATVNLAFRMSGVFEESVFLSPLEALETGQIVLSTTSRFDCDCTIAWLIRDRPKLVSNTRNGICRDGTPFESVRPQDLADCK